MSDTDALFSQDLFGDDATWVALANYVNGEADTTTVAAIEARVATDPAYAALVDSVRAMWELPFADLADMTDDDLGDGDGAVNGTSHPSITNHSTSAVDVDAAWARFEATLPLPPLTPTVTQPSRRPRRTAATYIVDVWRSHPVLWTHLLLFVVYASWRSLDHRYWHPRFAYHAGTTQQVFTLPDGSVATLTPGAYLRTGSSFLRGDRNLYLFGQAHFDVVHNPARPFIVHAFQAQATAVGTTFTMYADTSARVTIDVQTGKVLLSFPDPNGVFHTASVLTTGQARNVPALTRWLTQAGAMVGRAGVPFNEERRIEDATIRAAARLMRPPQ